MSCIFSKHFLIKININDKFVFALFVLLTKLIKYFIRYITPKSVAETTLFVNCSNIRYLEHVQARLTIASSRRGDLHIYLTSPMGTR